MIQQVGVGAVFLVENVGQGEKFLVGLEERLLHALQADLGVAEILVDAEWDERSLEKVLVETVVAQRVDEFDQMRHLARIDDAETVDVPADGVARFGDPPVVIFAEPHDAPVKG